jgi:hypothetical protein
MYFCNVMFSQKINNIHSIKNEMAKSKKIVAIQKDLRKLTGYGKKERINETYLCKKISLVRAVKVHKILTKNYFF